MAERSRLERLVADLKEFYGAVSVPPPDAFGVFVWGVLAFNTTPQKRDRAFASLKRHRALTPDAMSRIAPKTLEESVKLAGPYVEQRIRALRAAVVVFQRHPELSTALRAPLPIAQEAASLLPLSMQGAADLILLFAGGHRVLPIDIGTKRLLARLGYSDSPDAELPHSLETYRRVSSYLAHHAVLTCTDSDPRCGVCPIQHDCPTAHLQS